MLAPEDTRATVHPYESVFGFLVYANTQIGRRDDGECSRWSFDIGDSH